MPSCSTNGSSWDRVSSHGYDGSDRWVEGDQNRRWVEGDRRRGEEMNGWVFKILARPKLYQRNTEA